MRHLIIRICCFLLIISSIGIITPKTAHAASDLTLRSFCNLANQQIAWGGSAALHANGLLYVAKTISPVDAIKDQAYIAIYAIDPNSAGTLESPGSCKVIAAYLDVADNFVSVTALYDPAVITRDSQGNLYAGKSTNNSYRLLYIPSTAPANIPFKGLVVHNVIYNKDGRKGLSNFSALGITDTHAMISMNSWNGGDAIYADYTIVPIESIKDNSTSVINTSTWKSTGQVDLGLVDSIVGMPDGRFFLIASYVDGLGASFINPVTGVVSNAFDPSKLGIGYMNCQATNMHFNNIFTCNNPTASIGADNNLYVTALVVQRAGDKRAIVAWSYNPNTKAWSGIGNAPSPTLISALNNMESIGGANITADADGNVVLAMNGWKSDNTVLTFLNKKTNTWSVAIPNTRYKAFGKTELNLILSGDVPRISTLFPIGGLIYWGTYIAPINIVSIQCNPNVVVEGGSYYVNKTSVSGTIYTANTCKASRYVAAVSTNAKPVDPPTAPIKAFSKDNGNFSVSGLVPGLNYVHVRLYDTTAAIEKWVTNSVYVDTNATVQASVMLDNGNNIPSFKDNWSMRASSYTASGYTRSLIGTMRITEVTDPSGLASYAINDQPAVNFDTYNINKQIPVNFNNIESTVGISLTLTDGAGNTEVRGLYPLIYDVTPPDASSAPTASFTAAPNVFSGTIGLTGGTITDDLYAASGRQYWGVWVANAKCVGDVVGGCPADTASQLRWGAVPVTDPTSIQWNLLNGLNQVPSNGLYRTYIRFLDGAGNASTAAVTVDTTVTMTTNKIYMPLNFSQR
jgi:hypothetical protein